MQQQNHFKPELQRIFKDLAGKGNQDYKDKAGQELQQVYYKYISISEDIFTKLQKMISNQDMNEKYGGIVGLNYLTSAVQESQMITFVNKFFSVLFTQFQHTNDEKFIRKNAEVFGKLLKLGGSKIGQLLDSTFADAQKWLKVDPQKERKLAGLLVWKEMLVEAPSITFNKIFNSQQIDNFLPIAQGIRNKSLSIREAALELFRECVKQIAQRECIEIIVIINIVVAYQQEVLQKIYRQEVKKHWQAKEDETIHGNIMMIKILLSYAKEEVFISQISEQSQYVLTKRDSKANLVVKAVIETLPTLAKYGKGGFLLEFIETCIQFLIQQSVQAKNAKDKSLCYSTLSELFQPLDESLVKDKTKLVVKHIRDELVQRTKPFCVETITCLRTILKIHGKKFPDFTNIDVLVDQILLNGLHPVQVSFLNELCRIIPDKSEYIQYKLLQTIAAILIRKIITFVTPNQKKGFDIKILEGFQGQLQDAINTPDFTSSESIANAIQTLSTFVFENQQDNLAVFVKDAVLPYLANSDAVIRKATAKAGCLLYVKKNKMVGQQMISKNVMYEILDKFMNVAISDSEQEIRQTMLRSLNENFDQYLNAPKNLRKLFLCMNDPIPEVQEIALTILCRLSVLNPADIIPFLKKTLFEYLQTLTFESLPEKQIINQLYLLISLIKHGREIVQPYSANIANVLLQHLKGSATSASVVTYLLQAFSSLTENSSSDILVFLNEIFNIIINAMQDKSSTIKREAAVKSLNQIIKNTGFVVIPYYLFPQLMDIILQLIRGEVYPEMRQECMRLLGNLGAIDSFNYKKILGKVKKLEDIPYKFKFIQKYFQSINQSQQSQLINEVYNYYEDLILLGNFYDSKRMFMHLASIKLDPDLPLEKEMETDQITTTPQPYYASSVAQVDLDLLTPPVIQLNNIDYYSTVTIKTLLMIMLDTSLQTHHELALETLMWIVGTLKAKTANYLQYLVPVFAKLLQRQEDMREKVLSSLDKVIRLCGIQFGSQYIDQVIGCVLVYGQSRVSTVAISMDILATLIQFSKARLRHKIEPIVRLINSQISLYEDQKELIKKGIVIYRALEELLDSQLHMIVPFLCKLLTKEIQAIDNEIRKEIVHLFVNQSTNCPSSVQYLSLIINALLQVIQDAPQLVMNCFAAFIKQYRNIILVYLPMIHQAVQKLKIFHQQYNQCMVIFLNYGNLEDLLNLIDDDFSFFPQQASTYYAIEPANAPMYKKFDQEELMRKFDTTTRTLKDEWTEWMRNTSVELLKQSPRLVLSPCSSIAEMYPPLADQLYNIAFDSVWQFLNDKHKEQMIQHLTKAINTQENIPIGIQQMILNLAEFMQHDKEGLQIDISTLGELAERCMAFAKALYYREHEFETASQKTIQSLISLYTKLGLPESANGLLTYAKQNLKIQMKVTDYERLQKWDEALDDYRQQQLNSEEQDAYFIPKMRCFNALMQWNQLISQADRIFNDQGVQSIQIQKQIANLASNAAMHLGQWDKLEVYNQQVAMDSFDKYFWKAAVAINQEEYDEAILHVQKAREKLDNSVTGLLLESYERAQDGIIKLQQLTEMEEIIYIKQFQNKANRSDTKGEYSYLKMIEILEQRKQQLSEIWHDRLAGAPKNVEDWYKILSTRQLYQAKTQDIDVWTKFAKLALKRQKMVLCQDILEQLKKDSDQIPFGLYLISLECEYMQKKNEKELVERVRTYFSQQVIQIDSKLKAKTFFKLGCWVYERVENITKENLEQVNRLFDESLQFNPSYAKAWHNYALTNFEAVEHFKDEPDYTSKHVFSAIKGFIKSIALGFKGNKGKFILQDTLRLLQLIFKYGQNKDNETEFKESYKQIDVRAWIDVIPQILARIQIQNPITQELLQHVLIHISRLHPQALIYPLTVACKSKNQIRRVAVLKILDDMKSHSPMLVNEALLIAEELNRTAILLKEAWREGIQEAWNSYYQDKNKTHVERILRGLHDQMRVKPESLSEISFHQTFSGEIFEAETWFQRYLKTDDEVCLCQAFDIYYGIYRKIATTLDNLKMVHLENVSPKLLTTKNCEISIPGLFKPNKSLVKISGFAPKLQVLTSKQHPRRLCIYGNDGKEYHFLLKGHEDLRQDERVMQLFSLVNKLLMNDPETERKDLIITRYSVIPLSHNTGIIGWVQNCDTLQQLIREYRENAAIRSNTEANLMSQFCDRYDVLPLPNKVEIFRHILENTRGEDIQKVLWLKSQNSETWLERRTNYTRSLATMSMVGYILGLGDRHPSNIMLQKYTGKIVHIDFGDCFEVAMKREKFPEKVPFRLTRMLVKAMEACGIEGIYRHTCNIVMRVLRDNKESLLAVLDSFVYDPLLTWRLLNTASNKPKQEKLKMIIKQEQPQNQDRNASLIQKIIPENARRQSIGVDKDKMGTPKRKASGREKELYFEFADEEKEIPDNIQNQKGLEVIERIKKKLQGRDFKENQVLKFEEQVNKLILQATSHENISQAYIGWCPFW